LGPQKCWKSHQSANNIILYFQMHVISDIQRWSLSGAAFTVTKPFSDTENNQIINCS